ncbi:hypothetical protein CWE22_03760 [Pseudidiomarina aestuarii]|uniref:Carrier domain-containing protein n=1 Tax=Pseudidiomarina aestuarii TaxID=624146 RepID=A0A7Z7ETY5_9GAMM|nr:non-ribosomal peptide synthetase [Pseudidiomarina aestuarii]RUO41304.1 hypothetical protein CWE22_03760 [Pseudidiomarina aestuarii]
MQLTELLYQVNERGIFLWVEQQTDGEDKLKFSIRQPLDDREQWLAKIKPHKTDLIKLLKRAGVMSESLQLPIIYPSDVQPFPLSFAQKRLWFLQQFEPDSAAYNVPLILELHNSNTEQSITAAEQALLAVLERHQVLRTVLVRHDAEPVGLLKPATELQFDHQLLDAEIDQHALHNELRQELSRPFLLDQQLPVRAHYFQRPNHPSIFLITLHHIAVDGWSLPCLLHEFQQFYLHFSQGMTVELPSLVLQYQDFAYWQQHLLRGKLQQEQWQFWQAELCDAQPLELPLDRSRPNSFDPRGDTEKLQLDTKTSKGLHELARSLGCSFYTLTLSAYFALLHKYSQQDDLLIGTAAANRHYPGTKDMIGFFVNSLPIRCRTNPNLSLTELVRSVHESLISAQQYQDMPFDLLVEKLQLPRDPSCHPLFQVFFTLQQADEQAQQQDFTLLSPDGLYQIAKYDLSLFVTEEKYNVTLELNYATALFDQSTVAQMLAHYKTILQQLLEKPGVKLNQLQLLSAQQQQHLVLELNDTARALPDVSSVTALFSRQVSLTPHQAALSFGSQSLSYQELDQRSTELALQLLPVLEASPSKLVALLMERSLELIVAILAIHKAGGAYVPIATKFPPQRQNFILADTQAAALVSHQLLKHDVAALSGSTQVLWADSGLWQDPVPVNTAPPSPLPELINRDQLAYIIYTSGTTGNPKGVMLEHQHLLNRIDWMQNTYPLTATDKVLQKTPYNFDVSVWELLWANAYGAEIVVAEPEGHKDPDYLYQLIEQQQITVLHFVPTMFQAFLDDLQRRGRLVPSCLRYIFCSGEALSLATVQKFQQLNPNQRTQLHNLYGPTETAIDSSYFYCHGDLRSIPIGKPIQNTQLYILDTDQQLVPKGVAGELYIAGHGVARGYLNLPELTAERFLPNPFYHVTQNASAGRRMYKTGDRVRMRADGNIEYLGRNDFQVKLRGFRIELGEIEAALCVLPHISQALVMVKQAAGQDRLIAYCQTDTMPEPEQLRALLLQKLPDYMVPEHFIGLSRFPVNVNGKLDRNALPEPELKTDHYVAPKTEQEKQLVALWQRYLKIDKVGIEDDFFRLGGNSILAISVSHAMAELLQTHYPVARLFADKNIRNALVNLNQNLNPANEHQAIQTCTLAEPPLSFAQQRLWFLQQYDATNTAYNIPIALKVQAGSAKQLQQSLLLLVERHHVLRSSTKQNSEQARSILQPTDSFQLETIAIIDEDFDETFHRCVNYCFNLQQDIPLKAWYFELIPSQTTVLLINIHHSAFDGWSHGLFMAELEQAMQHFCDGQPLQLEPLPLQYQDYSHWQREAFTAGQFDQQLNYWQQQLQQLSPLQMPLDKPRPAKLSYAGDNLLFHFPATLTAQLKALASTRGCTLYSLMLSGFAILLHKYCGQQDIVLGTPFANRHHQHTEQLIGFFVNTLPLRLHIQPEQSAQQWLEQVTSTVAEAQLNQDLPFEYLVDLLKLQPDPSRHPVFQLLFSMDQFADPTQSAYFSEFDLGENYQVAKYDLSLYIKDEGEQLLGALNFSTALFSKDTMQRLTERYLVLMQQIAAYPQTRIDQLQWFSAADQHVLSNAKSEPDNTNSATFAERFYQQASLMPTQHALVWQHQSWTYQELDQESNQLAHQIRQLGCDSGDIVGLLLPRGPELILSILAILKAGCAYVPISPDFPLQRIRFILQDANCRLVLTDRLDVDTEVPVYNPAGLEYHQQPSAPLSLDVCGTDLAYVIYTSGTTGQPKGVMVEQHSFTDFLLNFPLYLPKNQPVQLLSLTAVTFDIFGLEYGLPLLRGGTLYLSDLQNAVADLQHHPQINLIQQTPSVLRTLLAMDGVDLSSITCLVGGEALDSELLSRLQHHFAQVVNVYGPTETVIWSTCHLYDKHQHLNNPLLIGNALPNEHTYVLDPDLKFLPAGVVGELYIGGAGLARGYLNRPELTAERFIIHPQTQERLYKTGDLVKQTLDGQLEYKGRTDFQVKIRGHRIELAEIESILQTHTHISQALVVAIHQEQQSEPYLAAYYQADSDVPADQLTAFVAQFLPDYMWPDVFIHIEQFSLTANGKLDRTALPQPHRAQNVEAQYQAPTTDFEQHIVQLWQHVLGLEQVGLNDDFFRIGGNSIKALLLCHKMAKDADWQVAVADLFHHRTIAALLKHGNSEEQQDLPVSESDNNTAPLSLAQNRLWFLYNLEPNSTAYHIPMLLKLETLDLARLEQAFINLINYQQVLCSVIEERDGLAWQQQVSADRFQLDYQKLSTDQLPAQIQTAVQMPFVLQTQLPIRATVFELDDGTYYLLILVHHIAFDGWSMDLLFSQLDQFYQQPEQTLPPLDYQYRDYARWQQNKNQSMAQNPYWKKLIDVPPLDLRTCYPRPKNFDYKGADLDFSLSLDLSTQVQALARQQKVSVYNLLLAVWSLTLHKLTGQQDILLGTPMANRQLPGSDALIGFFVNTQVLHHYIDPEADFLALLSDITEQSTAAQRYQELPFEQLLEQLSVDRDASRHPLFQVMFSVQTFAEATTDLDWLSPAPLPAGDCNAKYDLSFQLEVRDQHISGTLNYASSLYSERRIRLIQQGFVNLLQHVVNAPQSKNGHLSLLNSEQRAAMLALGNRQQQHSDTAYATTLNALFALQVADHPEQIAVQLDQQQLTYRELDDLSSQLAHQLLQMSDGEQQRMIALVLPRSVWMIVAILAVLKTGSAWVPIEPSTPPHRLQHILSDTQAKQVLSLSEVDCKPMLPEHCQLINLDLLDLHHQPETAPDIAVSKRDLAYVIYTSGTTGMPKGVLIEHQSVLNTILQQQQTYQIDSGSVLYLGLSYAFDAAVAVIMNALLSGAKLLLSKEIDFSQPCMRNVSHLILSGAVLDVLQPTQLPNLKYLIYGGAAASSAALQRFSHVDIYAEYGVTEAAITSSLAKVDLNRSSTIGLPLNNISLYVLDTQLEPVPFEVAGELYIGGVAVARGYLNQSELNESAFIPSPFIAGDRLYKTGDLVRWQSDDNDLSQLVFQGRKDKQLKLRGYRIELAEIEQQLLNHSKVRQAALKLHQMNGRDQLLAYLVTPDPEIEQLVAELKPRLADFMQPDHWLWLQQLPLTSNGKLDEAALPLPQINQSYRSPETATEQQLATLWQQLLGDVNIGRDDEFFLLGGDSILVMQLAALLKKAGWHCNVKALMQHRSLKAMSLLLDQQHEQHEIVAEQGLLSGSFNLLPIQQWFFDLVQSGQVINQNYWNQSFLVKVQPLDPALLQQAVKQLVAHHDILRVSFSNTAEGYRQSYSAELPQLILEDLDRATMTDEELEQQLSVWQSEFNIEQGPLFKLAYLHNYPDQSARLFFACHHLLIDAVSWRLLVEDLNSLYQQQSSRHQQLADKTTSYRQWVAAQSAAPQVYPTHYWQAFCATLPEVQRPTITASSQAQMQLSPEHSKLLMQQAHQAYQTEINELLLSALALALRDLWGHTNQAVLLESHGRQTNNNSLNLNRTMGWFTSFYPVMLAATDDLAHNIHYNKETVRQASSYGQSYIRSGCYRHNKAEHLAVSFNYLGQINAGGSADDWQIVAESSGANYPSQQRAFEPVSILAVYQERQLRFSCTTLYGHEFSDQLAARLQQRVQQLIEFCLQHQVSVRQSLCDYPQFNPYQLHNCEQPNTVFVFPPGEGDSVDFYQPFIERATDTRLVLLNNFYRYLLEHYTEQAASSSYTELAQQLVPLIKHIQPQGPWHFVGWSFGGVLALEVCRLLEQEQETLGSVQLIDSYFSLHKARLLSPELDALLANEDSSQNINANHQPSTKVQTKVTLYKASSPSGTQIAENLRWLEQAYLTTPANFIEDFAAQVEIIPYQNGHFDPLSTELTDALISGLRF